MVSLYSTPIVWDTTLNSFKDRFFIEPSLGIAGRPYYTEMPTGFKEKDDKWPKWTPEPGLHFGFNF